MSVKDYFSWMSFDNDVKIFGLVWYFNVVTVYFYLLKFGALLCRHPPDRTTVMVLFMETRTTITIRLILFSILHIKFEL